jgi:hypothetical protein
MPVRSGGLAVPPGSVFSTGRGGPDSDSTARTSAETSGGSRGGGSTISGSGRTVFPADSSSAADAKRPAGLA